MDQTKFDLKLFVFRLNKQTSQSLSKNYYSSSKEQYYSFDSNLSKTKMLKIAEQIETVSRRDLHKIGNPAKILFDSESDLLVCLGI